SAIAYEQEYSHIIVSFEKGLNNKISEFLTSKNQANDCLNVRYNDVFGAVAKRKPMVTYLDFGSAAVKGLHRYYKSDATVKTIAALGTELVADFSGTATTIKSGLTDGKRWRSLTFKNIVIGTNGYDQPQKYDGHTATTANTDAARTAGELCAELGAPFAELNTGTDLDASSWYQYKIAFYDGSTYDYSNARSNPLLTGADVHNITLTDIPIGPTGTTQRIIYRTVGDASKSAVIADTSFYRVATVSDNTTTTYNDAVSDTTLLTDTAPTWSTVSGGTNVTPPKGTIAEIGNERLFISGNVTYPSDVYWSDDGNPDHFLPSDFIVVREDDGDKITFLKPQLGVWVIGKTNSIQKFYTESSSLTDWYVSDPMSFVGCQASYSAASTPAGIVYLNRAGLYAFNGQSSQLISDAVTPIIQDISETALENVVGFYNKNEYHLSYTPSGATANSRVLVYDFVRDAYTLDSKSIDSFCSFESGTDSGAIYAGSSTTDGYVFAFSSAPGELIIRYQSDFTAGTFDDTFYFGSENDPYLELAWDCTIDTWLADLQAKDANINTLDDVITYLPTATIDRPSLTGTWTSQVYDISAARLDKIYWNESLGAFGDITMQVRLGASSSACLAASWETAVTNPSGSDISGITANRYIQIRANLSTTDITYTPRLYLSNFYNIRLVYDKVGAAYETSVSASTKTGWLDFGVPVYKKFLRRIKVFYEGTAGTLNLNYKNEEGDVNVNVPISLAVEPSSSNTDEYTGESGKKVFTYEPPVNSATDPSPIGQFWQFEFSENSANTWKIHRVEIVYSAEERY
ncbi:MAG TPA: hypothetical protein DCL42_04365, partial [Deltaproteobacteria bacterium]|nr:hypothetical protein [Deltaproteobacteria bacterium]